MGGAERRIWRPSTTVADASWCSYTGNVSILVVVVARSALTPAAIVGSHGQLAVSEGIFGSVTRGVITKPPCQVVGLCGDRRTALAGCFCAAHLRRARRWV